MSETNRVRLSGVKEVTLGTTPASPRMRAMRMVSESLAFAPQAVTSEEIRDDRMTADPILVGQTNQGGINFELIYPAPNTLLSTFLESAFGAAWTQTPERDNDGTADSVITGVVASTKTTTVTTGAAYVVGHLVLHTGFTNANNNGLFAVTTGGATSYIASAATMTDETAPPGAARSKVVGLQGASGDITATATGLGSTTLNFTTLGLSVGQWIKIGGTGAAFSFATAACAGWARITAIAATALTLDNLPSGWTTDTGTGKTIRVFFGDTLRNGTSEISASIERSFLAQTTPTHILSKGMMVNRLSLSFASKQKVSGSFDFMGMAGTQGTTANGTTYDASPAVVSYPVLAGSANLGRVAENGVALTGPNWAKSINLSITNNLRMIDAVDSTTAVDIGSGSQDVTAQVETYFGDNALLTKVLAMTPTNLNWRLTKGTQALVFGLPRVTPMSGTPNATGRNQDAMISLALQASKDTTTGYQLMLDRIEYFD